VRAPKPLLRGLERVGALAPAYRLYERVRALRGRNGRAESDGLPLPPGRLRLVVAGTTDAGWFLESGRTTAETIRAAAARHGPDLGDIERLLDFGCGCGRVTRHWQNLGAAVHGSDYNADLVEWCRRNLPFATFTTNRLGPPLPLPSESIDVAHAVSVLTHLPEDLQHAWLAELRRVLRPGGLLVVSTHGDRYLDRLDDEERDSYERGELVVRWKSVAGTNLCTAFHPEPYVREKLASDELELLEFAPEGAVGTPDQDLVVLRRTERPQARPDANS
jgi:SAM-dependent methyltransferase